MGTLAAMTDPSAPRQTAPAMHPVAPEPPRRPQAGMPPSWQQAGWSGAEPPVFLNTSPSVDVAPPRRSTRLRWVVALVGAILIVAAGVGVTVFAVGSQSNAPIG